MMNKQTQSQSFEIYKQGNGTESKSKSENGQVDSIGKYPNELFEDEPRRIIYEETVNRVSFNVMPRKPVEEKLLIREYRLWDRALEAVFDREYCSSMAKSPDHLTFVTALVHLQKMIYVYMCDFLNLDYDPKLPELLKVWPTKVEINMPKMMTNKTGITHRMYVRTLKKIRPQTYMIAGDSWVENRIGLNGQAVVIALDNPPRINTGET